MQRIARKNRLLDVLSAADFASLTAHFKLVPLRLGDLLITAGARIPEVHFVENGIVSLVAAADDGEQIEAALVGREGFVGVPVLLGADRTRVEARVQMAGTAYAMPSDQFRTELERRPALRDRLLLYAQVLNTQIAGTALANGRYNLEPRLARWLLMCHDRVDSDDLPTTHRFLSLMLGVNRPGLTTALTSFEREGLIAVTRGRIRIRARDRLLDIAGAAYGIPEAEYAALIGGDDPGSQAR